MRTCFSIMPFADGFNDIDKIVRAVSEDCGLDSQSGLGESYRRLRATVGAPRAITAAAPVEYFSSNGQLCLNCLCQQKGQVQRAHFSYSHQGAA